MVCDDVKRVAYFFLDGTLGPEKKQELERHLGDCPGCDDRITFHRRVRSFISTRLRRLTAPDGLRERITEQFSALRS